MIIPDVLLYADATDDPPVDAASQAMRLRLLLVVPGSLLRQATETPPPRPRKSTETPPPPPRPSFFARSGGCMLYHGVITQCRGVVSSVTGRRTTLLCSRSIRYTVFHLRPKLFHKS